MGKSRRKTPIIAVTTAESDKSFKRQVHRSERASIRTKLQRDHPEDAETRLPSRRLFGDPWRGDKDGKLPFKPAERPDLMRK